MALISQHVLFDDEAMLQDALAAKGVGGQANYDSLLRLLDAGTEVTIIVPGMPDRFLRCQSERSSLALVTVDQLRQSDGE